MTMPVRSLITNCSWLLLHEFHAYQRKNIKTQFCMNISKLIWNAYVKITKCKARMQYVRSWSISSAAQATDLCNIQLLSCARITTFLRLSIISCNCNRFCTNVWTYHVCWCTRPGTRTALRAASTCYYDGKVHDAQVRPNIHGNLNTDHVQLLELSIYSCLWDRLPKFTSRYLSVSNACFILAQGIVRPDCLTLVSRLQLLAEPQCQR